MNKVYKLLTIATIMALMAAIPIFAGGGGQQTEATRATAVGPNPWNARYTTPVTLTFGRDGASYQWGAGEFFDNSIYSQYIKDTLNIEVRMAWIAGDDLAQRITLAIASGDLPDVMFVNNRLQLEQLFQGNMVTDMTGLFNTYASPVYKAMVDSFGGLEQAMSTAFHNDRQLAFANLNPGNQDQLFWIREDWRLQLGLPEPRTTNDFISLADAFVRTDLAGNRQTIGFEVNGGTSMIAGHYNGVRSMDPFFNERGAYPINWHDDGTGRLVYGSITPQARETLILLRDMYDRGLIARDFATRDGNASIAAGFPGVVVGPWWTWGWPLYQTIDNNPNAVWKVYPYTSSVNGRFNTMQQNFNTTWHVVRRGHPNPEALIKILNLHAEFMISDGAQSLTDAEKRELQYSLPNEILTAYMGRTGFDWGSWPTRIQLSFNDIIVRMSNILTIQLGEYRRGARNFGGVELETFENILRFEAGDHSRGPQFSYMDFRGRQLQAEVSPTMNVMPIFYPSITPTMSTRWAHLQDMEILAYTRIIMGQEPITYFDAFVRDWLAQGCAAITDEVNQQYMNR